MPLYLTKDILIDSLIFCSSLRVTMSQFVRASKFRHVYSDPPRPDATFQNLRLSTVTGEQNYIKANPYYFAVGIQVNAILLFPNVLFIYV